MKYPVTPDGRYFVHGTTLWRCTNPTLSPSRRSALQKDLMDARRNLRKDKLARMSPEEVTAVRRRVDDAKVALGERGPIWWEDDGWGDLNRHGVAKGPYKEWWTGMSQVEREGRDEKRSGKVKKDESEEEDGASEGGERATAEPKARAGAKRKRPKQDDDKQEDKPSPSKRRLRSDDKNR